MFVWKSDDSHFGKSTTESMVEKLEDNFSYDMQKLSVFLSVAVLLRTDVCDMLTEVEGSSSLFWRTRKLGLSQDKNVVRNGFR